MSEFSAVRHPRPKCGHAPGHEAGQCVPTLESYWATHLNEYVDMMGDARKFLERYSR